MATVFASGATLGPDGMVIPVVDVGLPSNVPPAEDTPPAGSGSAEEGPAGDEASVEPPVLDDEPEEDVTEDAGDDGREGRPSRRERRKTYVQGVMEENRWLRQQVEQQRLLQAQPPPPPDPVPAPQVPLYQVPKPQRYQFGTDEEYIEGVALWVADRRDYERQVQWQAQQQAQAVQQAQARWQQREEEGRERYGDFDAVEQRVEIAPHLAPLVADTVRDLEIGADILYFLGTNPKAQKTLNQMDVWAAGRWLGQLQLQLEGKRQRSTSGPGGRAAVLDAASRAGAAVPPIMPPMAPVGTGGALPVTGFRSGMSLPEYEAWRRPQRESLGLRP